MSLKRVKALITLSVTLFVCLISALCLMFAPWGGSSAQAELQTIEGTTYKITSDTKYDIAPGVTERSLKTSNTSVATEAFVMEIDTSREDVHVVAGYGNRKPGSGSGKLGWSLTPLTKQASLYEETHADRKVVGGINASNFNVGTGEPNCMLVMDGKTYKNSKARPYLAIFENGKAKIFGKTTVTTDPNTLHFTIPSLADAKAQYAEGGEITEAVGGWFTLLEGGNLSPAANLTADGFGSNAGKYPRTAVGVKSDGTVVFLQADGMQAPRSTGYTIKEMACLMKQLGCVDAMELDEGGSSTYISRRAGDDTFVQRNISAGGTEREISSTILVTSSATPNGTFSKAIISPNNEYYSPKSEIELSAIPVDSSYQPIGAMPEDITWSVAETAGTIDSERIEGHTAYATFKAKDGFTGDVTIEIKREGEVVGSTKIGIYAPDTYKFDSPVLNLGFGETTDLGLKGFYQEKEVKLHVGDVTLTAKEKDTGNTDIDKYGHFDGLNFVITENWKISGTIEITATYGEKADKSITVTVNIGLKPVIMLDGGDTDGKNYEQVARLNNGKAANQYVTDGDNGVVYNPGVNLLTYYYGKGGNESIEQVTTEDPEVGEFVRFGDKAIKLNWDFSGVGKSSSGDIAATEGACIGFTDDYIIDDSPSAFGVWIYAPEGTPNFWLRGCIHVQESTNPDGSIKWGGDTWLDFTQQYVSGYLGGLEWTGWKYVSVNLQQYAGKKIMIPKGMSLRFMITSSGCGRYRQSDPDNRIPVGDPNYKGWLLIDNYQFEYGSNTQDTVAPVIETFTYGSDKGNCNTPLEDGVVLDTNNICFRSEYTDSRDTNKYNVGLAQRPGLFYIDGNYYGGYQDGNEIEQEHDDETDTTYIWKAYTDLQINLSNGVHCIEMRVKDASGNETIKSAYVTVNAPNETALGKMWIEADDSAPLGGTYSWKVYAVNPSNVSQVSLKLKVTQSYFSKLEDITCTPTSGYKISDVENQRPTLKSGEYSVIINRLPKKEQSELVATISIKIAEDIGAGSSFNWSARCAYDLAHNVDVGVGQDIRGFCTKPVIVPVVAGLSIEARDQIVGLHDGEIYVYDGAGNPVSGANVYLVNGENDASEIGTTDSTGKLIYKEAGDIFTKDQGTYTIYARLQKEGSEIADLSFHSDISSYNPIFAPAPAEGSASDYAYYVIYNSVKDMTTQKNISWMAYMVDSSGAPLAKQTAKIQYSTNTNLDGAITVDGDSFVMSYAITGNATIVNNVQISGLTPGTTYYYKVGDGEHWSPVASFTTLSDLPHDTSFYILGDMQGDITIVEKMGETMQSDGVDYQFGIQTGDIVDNPNSYDMWKETLEMISQGIYIQTDFVHVIGNHEAEGDLTTAISRKTFGIPVGEEGDFYAYEYGDVYVAVLNYTLDASRLRAFGQWLVEDSANTDCTWKIVVAHVPVYGTNPAGGTDKIYRDNLESYLLQAGVDFFFAGNDHSYARTKPFGANGAVDEENGIVHYIIGTAGEKKYDVDTQGFEFVKADQKFNAIYMSVVATKRGITINAWNVLADGPAQLYDSYTKGAEACDDGLHKFVYDSDSDYFTCKICGRTFAHDSETINLYSGIVDDIKTGLVKYMMLGNFYEGSVREDGKVYSFRNQFGLDGTVNLCGYNVVFDKGLFVSGQGIKAAGVIGVNVSNTEYVLLDDGEFILDGEGECDINGLAGNQPYTDLISEIKAIYVKKEISGIGSCTFWGAVNAKSLVFEEGSTCTHFDYAAFNGLGLATDGDYVIKLPDSLRHIGCAALRDVNCKLIVIPEGITSFDVLAFDIAISSPNNILKVNVAEGTYAHNVLKQYSGKTMPKYSVRNTLCTSDTTATDFSGVVTVRDGEDATTTATYYCVNGEVKNTIDGKFAALAASVNSYNALTADQKTAQAEDYATLSALVDEYNEEVADLETVHESAVANAKSAFGGVAAAVATLSVLSAAAWIASRKMI